MRLASILDVPLPSGTLHHLAVRARPRVDRPLPISFDQRRHVSDGDRPGSWIALSLRLDPHVDAKDLARAWRRVLLRHPDLCAVFSRGPGGEITLHEGEVSVGGWYEVPTPDPGPSPEAPDRTVVPDRTAVPVNATLQALLDRTCRPLAEPSSALCVVTPSDREPDRRPVAVIASDHAHVDMWSMLVLATDLRTALACDEPMPPAARFSRHTALLAERGPVPAQVLEDWRQVLAAGEGTMPTFPLPLGDLSVPRPDVVSVREVLDGDGLAGLDEVARAQGVRTTALALTAVSRVTQDMSGRPLRAVFPVHSRDQARWRDACGWFITNSVLDVEESRPDAVTDAVRRAVRRGAVPLRQVFSQTGRMPTPPGMLAVSWMDVRRMAVRLPPEARAQAITASLPTDGVMIWFVAEDEGLHLRCRYPATDEARVSVRAWTDGIVEAVRGAAEDHAHAAAPVAPRRERPIGRP
jgi:hypothetical protein